MSEYYIKAQEVMNILEVKETKAYKIIRELNQELRNKGFITVSGRVSRKYFFERCGVIE